MPLISIAAGDDDVVKNRKRLLKVLLFEILHEDALAADADVILKAILRPPNLITPFEEMRGTHVTYVMEPGATTLAYAYRKLAHDFYDMPGERVDNIVAEKFRTREGLVEVALTLGQALGANLRRDILEYYVSTDLGFPKDFKSTLEKDIKSRPGATTPLDQTKDSKVDTASIVAETFHEKWQRTTTYFERWKPAQTAFKDGTGINDSNFVRDQAALDAYFVDRGIPSNLQKYYSLRPDPRTGQVQLYEDIQHLPHRFLAPNNQYENIEGARLALSLVHRMSKLRFRSVEQAKAWLQAAAQEQNKAWLIRNRHWAKGNQDYDRHWRDLRANLRFNNLNFFVIALDATLSVDAGVIENSQLALVRESLRQLSVEISKQAAIEARRVQTGERIHEAWQKRSGYASRFKPADAMLDDGGRVNSEATLKQYLSERGIPPQYQIHFRLVQSPNGVELHEDLQNLPQKFLAPNHQSENDRSAELSLKIVDRLWSKGLSFRNVGSAERWLMAAAQAVHLGVLERNTNQSLENPIYRTHWLELPPINQYHDLAVVKSALITRFEFNPESMPQEQKKLLLAAVENLERRISSGGVRSGKSCSSLFTN